MSAARRQVACAALAVGVASGCTDGSRLEGDAYPIYVDRSSGAIVVGAHVGDQDRTAVFDLMAPVSVLDAAAGAEPLRVDVELGLLGRRSPSDPMLVPRAALSVSMLTFDACATDPCLVGDDGGQVPVDAIIGADAVAGDAPRFDFGAGSMTLLPSIAGTNAARSAQCDAVFRSPFHGGGTLLIGGAEVEFTGSRIVLAGCLAPDPFLLLPLTDHGTDVLLVQSTGVGHSILGASAYERYRQAEDGEPPALEALPTTTVQLTSGPLTGGLAEIPALTLTGELGSDPRGACGDAYANHYLVERDCEDIADAGCPCRDGQACNAPAVVELEPAAGVTFLIVADDTPVLQALRAELRPDLGEIDGILGTEVLASTELDVDYPGSRLLWRCTDPAACTVRPELLSTDRRADVAACLP